MQRQSLGSPGSKLHTHGVASSKEDQKILLTLEDLPKRNNNGGNSSASNSPINDYDDDEEKKIKATKPHKSPSKPDSEKFIHFIPILTLLCFLILYLCSHNPSQSDLAQFDGFKRPSSKSKVYADNNDLSRFVEMNKGDVLAIRSLMNLEQIRNAPPKFRSHRKLGDF